MSRANQTPQEQKTSTDLLEFIKNEDENALFIDREVNDKPDLLFSFNNIRAGCECVQIPPGRIYKYVHTRFKELNKEGESSAAVKVVWPQEPHSWMKEVIETKAKNIRQYKLNSAADKMWLLVHTPLSEKDNTIRYKNKTTIELLKFAATNSKHKFDRIYFWDPHNGIQKLFPINYQNNKLNFDFSKGYPTDSFLMSRASFKTTSSGEPPKTYDFGIVEPRLIVIPPIDPEFKRHKPNISNYKYHFKIIAKETDAELLFQRIENE